MARQRQTAPRGGRSGDVVGVYLAAKCPRSVFLHRASFRLALIAREIAEYGDVNGDGTVSASDFIVFRQYFGGVNPIFDFDGDGSVSASDFIQFRLRFGGSI